MKKEKQKYYVKCENEQGCILYSGTIKSVSASNALRTAKKNNIFAGGEYVVYNEGGDEVLCTENGRVTYNYESWY